MTKHRADQARHAAYKPKGARVKLAETHRASVKGETIFPSRVFHASVVKNVLKSGNNSRKTGKMVEKGAWKGFPIYTLTLEERATCSRACKTWDRCYGNNMQYADRIMQDDVFEMRLVRELHALQAEFPAGFVVRLHVLGDFYSVEYVDLWKHALDCLPALRIWGYTGREPDSDIGMAILGLNVFYPERIRIRFSGFDIGGMGSLVISDETASKHTICPAQLEKTAVCATCAFCWTANGVVEFLEH